MPLLDVLASSLMPHEDNGEQEQGQECSPNYITITNIYNQKVAAAGDDQLAEPTLPFLFDSGMF